jgi:hypothetical protein
MPPIVDRRTISGIERSKTQRIGFSSLFDAILKRKTAWDAAQRSPRKTAPVFSTGSGGFWMAGPRRACE